MSGHEGIPDKGVLRSDGRCDNRIDKHSFFKQVVCHLESLIVIADEEGNDRRGCVSYLAPHGSEVVESEPGDLPQMLLPLWFGKNDIERGIDGSS